MGKAVGNGVALVLVLLVLSPPLAGQPAKPAWVDAGASVELRPASLQPDYYLSSQEVYLTDLASRPEDRQQPLLLPPERLPTIISQHATLGTLTAGTPAEDPMGRLNVSFSLRDAKPPATRELQPGELPVLLDESGGTGTGHDLLYVDADADGDLSDEQPLRGVAADSAGPAWEREQLSARTEVLVRYPQGSTPAAGPRRWGYTFGWYPAAEGAWVEAETLPLVGWVGTGDRRTAVGVLDEMADASLSAEGGDQVWLDLDGDRRIAPAELYALDHPICLWGTYVALEPALDGTRLQMSAATPEGSPVRLEPQDGQGRPAKIAAALFYNTDYDLLLDSLWPPAEVRVPSADTAAYISYELEVTAPEGGSARYQFEIGAEENQPLGLTVPLQLGGPIKATIAESEASSGYVMASFALATEAGHNLQGVQVSGQDVAPGRARLLRPDGKVADEQSVEFG